MRFALLVLLCFGITVLCGVEARKQCPANAASSTATAATQLKSILAVVPAATTTVKPTVKTTTPKPVVKTTAKPAVKTTKKPVVKATPKAVAKTTGCPNVYPPWHLTKIFNGRARCVGLKNIPKTTKTPADLAAVCRSKHPKAKPMSFHSAAQLEWCKKNIVACNGALTGMYVPAGLKLAPQNLRNLDGEKVDFHPYQIFGKAPNAFQIVSPIVHAVDFKSYTGNGLANVVCAFWYE